MRWNRQRVELDGTNRGVREEGVGVIAAIARFAQASRRKQQEAHAGESMFEHHRHISTERKKVIQPGIPRYICHPVGAQDFAFALRAVERESRRVV